MATNLVAKKCSPQIQGDNELAGPSSVQDLHMAEKEVVPMVVGEIVGQASPRLNSALSRREWLNSITGAKKKAARTNESQTPVLIRKVPPILRTEDFKTYYEPRVVSIGPYHHNGDPRLQQVEELKPLIAKQFVDQYFWIKNVDDFFYKFEEGFDKIINPGIKGLYDETVTKDIDEEEFKRMMFFDGCFVLYFILCIHYFEVERMGLKNHLIASVQQDLFLVENQLPFQVLKILISLSAVSVSEIYLLEEFIHDTNTFGQPIWMSYRRIEEPLHLLDIFWTTLLGNNEEINIEVEPRHENKNHIKRHLFHGVKELTVAGIHLRPNSSGSLRDIKFRSYGIFGTLTLPRMTIERSTRQILLNLIAHEACMDNRKKFGFTSYICFLDLLIDHAEDVKALRTAGILENYLDSDEEVAKLYNEIGSDLLPEFDTYKEVTLKIQRYLHDKRKVKMASWVVEVIRDHFKSPWTIIALLAGIIVISIAFVQTYFTIFPRSK